MDMLTCPGTYMTTISGQHTLDPLGNSPDSCAQIWATVLRDGMGISRVLEANPHHHKLTRILYGYNMDVAT